MLRLSGVRRKAWSPFGRMSAGTMRSTSSPEPCSDGLVLLTSRVSVEMVQKTARMGSPILAAISAPTALAVRVAESCGITLVAIARGDAFEVFTHPERIGLRAS